MADIELVIKIPEEQYNVIRLSDKTAVASWVSREAMLCAIRNGTPLPKGHGRLIDADEYKEELYACATNGRPLHRMSLDEILATVDEAPTIIEADTESEERE